MCLLCLKRATGVVLDVFLGEFTDKFEQFALIAESCVCDYSYEGVALRKRENRKGAGV